VGSCSPEPNAFHQRETRGQKKKKEMTERNEEAAASNQKRRKMEGGLEDRTKKTKGERKRSRDIPSSDTGECLLGERRGTFE